MRKSITESTILDAAMAWNHHPYEGRGPAPVPSWCTGDAVTGRWSLVTGRWSPAASRATAEEPAAEGWPLSIRKNSEKDTIPRSCSTSAPTARLEAVGVGLEPAIRKATRSNIS